MSSFIFNTHLQVSGLHPSASLRSIVSHVWFSSMDSFSLSMASIHLSLSAPKIASLYIRNVSTKYFSGDFLVLSDLLRIFSSPLSFLLLFGVSLQFPYHQSFALRVYFLCFFLLVLLRFLGPFVILLPVFYLFLCLLFWLHWILRLFWWLFSVLYRLIICSHSQCILLIWVSCFFHFFKSPRIIAEHSNFMKIWPPFRPCFK